MVILPPTAWLSARGTRDRLSQSAGQDAALAGVVGLLGVPRGQALDGPPIDAKD